MEYRTMANGKKIKIKDMTDSHIQNCISMLNRKLANKPTPYCGQFDGECADASARRENDYNDRVERRLLKAVVMLQRELDLRN